MEAEMLGSDVVVQARWILPMYRPPIREGYLRLWRGKLVELGERRQRFGRAPSTVELGDVALLPRLVNAHTHLEFSDLAAPVGQPGVELSRWIGQVIAARGEASFERHCDAIARGLAESAHAGVGLIGDIATTPSQYPPDEPRRGSSPNSTSAAAPQLVSFAEVLGLSVERHRERFAAAERHAAELARTSQAVFGVSPHAPYSTPWNTVERCVGLAQRHRAPLAMHVAESPAERELLAAGSGPFAEALKAAGLWQGGLFPWNQRQPVAELLGLLAAAPRALVIHGNDLTAAEMDQVAASPQLSVVYCPRTHHFFRHRPHPIDRLLRRGVRVALGTDSRASNPDLSVWREVQYLLRQRPDVSPEAVMKMATLWGAEALLGSAGGVGTLRPGATVLTGIAGFPTSARSLDQLWRDACVQELRCGAALWQA